MPRPPASARSKALVNAPVTSVTYFDNTLADAMDLAREARNFIVYQDSAEAAKLDPAARLVISCEAMRVTARIGQIVAWLLVQKAVHAGELTRAQAAEPHYRLAGQTVCEASQPLADEKLPARLGELLERSHGLYTRVARLDAMLDAAAPEGARLPEGAKT